MNGLNRKTALAAILLAGIVTAACKGKEAEDATAATPTSVAVGPENVAVVTQAELSAGPAISGALSPEREATVRAQVPGAVMSVTADQGSRVLRPFGYQGFGDAELLPKVAGYVEAAKKGLAEWKATTPK